MSVERLWHWLCNVCGSPVILRSTGLPRGWMIFHSHDAETMHACTTCAPTVPGAKPPTSYGGVYARE